MSAPTDLVAQLVAIRRLRGLSQTAVARRLYLTPAAVSNFESGRYSPNVANLARYAEAVGARIVVEEIL